MNTNDSLLRFIHISDSHITKDSTTECIKLINYINHLPLKLDFIFHTGDIVGNSEIGSYQIAQNIFSKSIYPIYYAPGNYEILELYKQYFIKNQSEVNFFSDYSYYKDINNFRVISLNVTILNKTKYYGEINEDELQKLNQLINSSNCRLIIFLHFPVVELDSKISTKDLCLINGDAFHNLCKHYKEKIVGIFYGHVHRGMTIYKDDILYSSVASVISQFNVWPDTLDLSTDDSISMRCNLVTVKDRMVIIKELATK